MADYSHTNFPASSPRTFRRGLLHAINADFRIDVENGDDNLSRGSLRHTLTINGRHIAYEAVIGADGRLDLTVIETFTSKQARSLEQIKKAAADRKSYDQFMDHLA